MGTTLVESSRGGEVGRPATYPATAIARRPWLGALIRYGTMPLMALVAFGAYGTLATRGAPHAVAIMAGLSGVALVAVPLERIGGGLYRRTRRRLAFDAFFTVLMIALEAVVATLPARFVPALGARFGLDALWPRALPAWAQFLVALLVCDFLAWLVHFLQHRKEDSVLWRMHSVHHTLDGLDMLAGTRNHPYDVLTLAATSLPVLLFGGGAELHAAVMMANLFFNSIHHVNLEMEAGPLERVFVTPRQHFWHHGRRLVTGVNFGHVLAFWDLAFGTHHTRLARPSGAAPSYAGRFGLDAPHTPPEEILPMLATGASKRGYERYVHGR